MTAYFREEDSMINFLQLVNIVGLLVVAPALIATTPIKETDSQTSLELVQVVFRHGDRNVFNADWFHHNDPHGNESYWPEGFAQLTKKGKQQHYALGQWLRGRYSNFLSRSYSPYEIFVQSSDVDRTIMSAQANLAGLYPPNETDPISMWNEEILWQPIPVHTIPEELDRKLRHSEHCPKLKSLVTEFDSAPEMAAIYSENIELFQHLENSTGKSVRTLTDIGFLYDALLIQSLYNYSLPLWTEGYFPGGQFYNLSAMSFKRWTWTDELKELTGGPLIKDILKHFQEKVNGSKFTGLKFNKICKGIPDETQNLDKRLKMFMYSGHDTSLVGLLDSLGIWDGIPPPYAAAVIMELRKNAVSGSYFVETFYRNETNHAPYSLELPGCAKACPLETFIELTKPFISGSWEEKCIF